MKYRGYNGTIQMSMEDVCMYGRVLDLLDDTLISYEGGTLQELREDFQGAIDDYLSLCEDEGIEPKTSRCVRQRFYS